MADDPNGDRLTPTGRPRRVLVAVAVLALGLAGCGSPTPSGEAHPQGEGQAATVETLDFRFSPRSVEVESGKPLTVTVRNVGVVSHTFTTDDPAVDVVVPPDQRRQVTLTVHGQVNFFCRFHHADGMQGALCPKSEECSPPGFP